MNRFAATMIPLVFAGSLACKKEAAPPPNAGPAGRPVTTMPAPVTVTVVTLGKAIGADKRVTTPAETFGPQDTIYAVVDTAGSGQAKLRALWTFVEGDETATVEETTIEIDVDRDASLPAVNEFHAEKPGGWPKGDYRVDIFLNDATAPAVTRSFKVG